MVRVAGVALLGRPRSPRAVAAEDVSGAEAAALIGLAVLGVLAGLFPGPLLMLLGDAVQRVAGSGMEDGAGWFTLSTGADQPGYSAPGIALLLGVAGVGGALAVRPWAAGGVHRAPRWDGGLGPPPPWLPFGDPSTQGGTAPLLVLPSARLGAAWQDGAARLLQLAGAAWERLAARVARHGVALVLCAFGVALGMAAWLVAP